jgi:DNA-binding beta-propeller fold protein YncE
MRRSSRSPRLRPRALGPLAALAALNAAALSATALAAPAPQQSHHKAIPGTLKQLRGARGCLVDRSTPSPGCGTARALEGAGPFMGSRAVVVSPDGRNVYVASSRGNAVAVFRRNPRNGALGQPSGAAGCIAAKGAEGCAGGIGLNGPNSVAVSADGRSVYVTARGSNAVTAFQRNRSTGTLRQLPGAGGCIAGVPLPGCITGTALLGPDVVVVSRDGANVYVGSFFGNAVAIFSRDPKTGALSQPVGAAGCIAAAIAGCASGLALGAPEGMAISGNGAGVYVASALSNAVVVLARDPATGALTQASDGSGCIVDTPLAGCTTGVQLSGANAVALSPDEGDAYVTSLFSDSVTSFNRSASSGALAQKPGTGACLVWLRSVGCSLGRALSAPEGLAVSPDGENLYVAAFAGGVIDVFDRGKRFGIVRQKPGRAGCVAPRSVPGCTPGRALRGVSSIALSPDGRNVYATAFGSNALDVFRRIR